MAAWANLSGMTSFNINSSLMTGTLPTELATAWPKLNYLDLGFNSLAGKAPAHAHRAAGCGGSEQVQAGGACMKQLTEKGHLQALSQALGRRCRCSTLTCATTLLLVRDVAFRQCRYVAAASTRAHAMCIHQCPFIYSQVPRHACNALSCCPAAALPGLQWCPSDQQRQMLNACQDPDKMLCRYFAARVWRALKLVLFRCWKQQPYWYAPLASDSQRLALSWFSTKMHCALDTTDGQISACVR